MGRRIQYSINGHVRTCVFALYQWEKRDTHQGKGIAINAKETTHYEFLGTYTVGIEKTEMKSRD